MARLDTRIISDAIPEEWLMASDAAETPELLELQGETREMREWRMIVAFLSNC